MQFVRKCLGQANLEIYKCMNGSRKDELASQYLDEALVHSPHCPVANYEKGLRHIQSDEKEDAKARFEKSVEADWNHWPSHMELAKLAKSESQWQKAEMHLKIVLDLDLENLTAKVSLSFSRRFKNQQFEGTNKSGSTRILAVGPTRKRNTQKIQDSEGKQKDPLFLHEYRYAETDYKQNQQGPVSRDLEPDVTE